MPNKPCTNQTHHCRTNSFVKSAIRSVIVPRTPSSTQKCPAPSISLPSNCDLSTLSIRAVHDRSFLADTNTSPSPYTASVGCCRSLASVAASPGDRLIVARLVMMPCRGDMSRYAGRGRMGLGMAERVMSGGGAGAGRPEGLRLPLPPGELCRCRVFAMKSRTPFLSFSSASSTEKLLQLSWLFLGLPPSPTRRLLPNECACISSRC